MNSYRKTAITVGILFIIATVINVLGIMGFINPILDAPDYLLNISVNESRMLIGALLVLFSAFASASIAIWLYPVLKKQHAALALGSVGFRVMEGMLYIVGMVGLLALLTLSQEYAKAGAANASLFQASGTALLAVRKWAGGFAVIAFSMGAMMYYSVFFQSKLVPRFLSGWGVLGAALSLAAALLGMFGRIIPFSPVFIIMNFTIFLQEMVLALWLIVKGFNPSAVASLSANKATN
jgi:hypothetical protein